MKTSNKFFGLLLLLILTYACSKDDSVIPDQDELKKVDEVVTSSSLFDIQFFSEDSLFVGYNKVYFRVKDRSTGKEVSQARIELHPLMDMVTFTHACPLENPAETPDALGYFKGAILFSMPGSNNSWSLSADVTANGKSDKADFSISKVVATSPAKKIVVVDSLSNGPGSWIITKYPVSLVEPSAWKVGNNQFEITIHMMESRMSFPCCNDISVEIIPEMPSMGHGSPNNVNPVSTGNGHYAGTVNFTMTGAWRVNMIFKKGGRVIGKNNYFDIIL